MLKILLAEHHAAPRWALKTMIDEETEFELAGEATETEELRSLNSQLCPDLIIMDSELPGGSVEDLISVLHRENPSLVVIVMSSNPEHARMMLKAGADVFVSKGEQTDWLLHVLNKFSRQKSRKPTNSI